MDMSDVPATHGRRRVAIENVTPALDCGRFAIKRLVGDKIIVAADVFADGHDVVRAVLLYRSQTETNWREVPMTALGNDRWQAEFTLAEVGRYEYSVQGWVDAIGTWHRDLKKRIEAGQDIALDLRIGAEHLADLVPHVAGADAEHVKRWQLVLAAGASGEAAYRAGTAELEELIGRHSDRTHATQLATLGAWVDRPKAGFSTWYELFPRSCSGDESRHGTFRDCIAWLPRLAELGFDVLYMPPIHPVGMTFRKGKNNAVMAQPDDHGCPWAVGGDGGGHKAVLKDLGTLEDFRALLTAAEKLNIEIALDIAFQCSPDHPYVKEHPQWFRARPDGTIQYAENPPKKYQDIYPFDFETDDWQALWQELTEVVLYWCEQGVRIFRVDNPHTKPFAFWEYLIARVKAAYPEALFLSEAFTRPKVMYRLAKLGFTQSYTYFTWRNTKAELIEYFTELTSPALRDFFRPNLWPNTPDILVEHLQTGGRAAFVNRLVLAGTLSSNYGIYGPAFEAMEHSPREAGSEEYLNSEKYQLRAWQFDSGSSISPVIAAVNRARKENPALQSDANLHFHSTDNEQLLCYSKHSADLSNVLLMVVSLNFHELQRGFLQLPLAELGIDPNRPYQVQDLISGQTFTWQGPRVFVELDPANVSAHLLRVLPQG